jgi:hypothetical protein
VTAVDEGGLVTDLGFFCFENLGFLSPLDRCRLTALITTVALPYGGDGCPRSCGGEKRPSVVTVTLVDETDFLMNFGFFICEHSLISRFLNR